LLIYRITKNELNHFHENIRILKMFKKSLLAATLAAFATGAMAVDVDTNTGTETYGSEALVSGLVANDGTVLDIAGAAVTLLQSAEYSAGDIVKITILGGTFGADGAYTLTDTPAGTNETITWGLLNQTDTQLTFRVTSISTGNNGTVIGNTAALVGAGTLADATVLASTAVGAKVTVTAKAETSTGIPIDNTANDTAEIGEVIAEHALTLTEMAAVIDVSAERKEFVAAGAANIVATYAYTAATQANFAGTANVITINGSMVGFPGTATGLLDDGAVTAVVAADLQSATLTYAAPPATKTATFAVATTPANRAVLTTGTYTLGMEITDTGKSTTLAAAAAGAMTLNGASEIFAYVPVNYPTIVTTQFEIGNKGSVDGEITLSGFDSAGNDYSAVLPFNAEAGKLTKVSDADITTAFGLTEGTKLRLTITVNAPGNDITVAGYSNRGTTGRMSLVAE
jgi:hypothetical protein